MASPVGSNARERQVPTPEAVLDERGFSPPTPTEVSEFERSFSSTERFLFEQPNPRVERGTDDQKETFRNLLLRSPFLRTNRVLTPREGERDLQIKADFRLQINFDVFANGTLTLKAPSISIAPGVKVQAERALVIILGGEFDSRQIQASEVLVTRTEARDLIAFLTPN